MTSQAKRIRCISSFVHDWKHDCRSVVGRTKWRGVRDSAQGAFRRKGALLVLNVVQGCVPDNTHV